MSTLDSPNIFWDKQTAAERKAEEAINAVERQIYKEVDGVHYLSDIGLKHELDVDPEGVLYDVITAAYNKGLLAAAETQHEHELEETKALKKFRVVSYMRAEVEDWEPQTYSECEKEVSHLEMMDDGENLYVIEEV
tara:strand:+ start:895 stop:1302 length:408 start_codon:yes stop_codon:yes gene_type:complete